MKKPAKAQTQPATPLWVRLPRSGDICPYTGLRRSILDELTVPSRRNKFSPAIRSVLHTKPGNRHGFRLMFLPSALEYLSKLADQQAAQRAS